MADSVLAAVVTRPALALEALAADAPLPWRIEDGLTGGPVTLLDAENAYVCEVDPREFAVLDGSADDGTAQARHVAELILAAVTRPDRTATAIVDALIAGDDRALGDARVELAAAAASCGLLLADAVALTALDGLGMRRRIVAAVYDLLRFARAMNVDLDEAIAALVQDRTADRARMARQQDRVGIAADRARAT